MPHLIAEFNLFFLFFFLFDKNKLQRKQRLEYFLERVLLEPRISYLFTLFEMSSKSTPQKAAPFIDIDDLSLKDLKFCVSSFFAIVLIIFHYAWIMRQWVLNPDLPRTTIAFYLATLVVTVVVSFGVLAKIVHPKIYRPAGGPVAATKKNE